MEGGRPPIRNVETPVSYQKQCSAIGLRFIYKLAICPTNRFEINYDATPNEICHGKRVGKSCLFMTSTDTPRHKQVGKKY